MNYEDTLCDFCKRPTHIRHSLTYDGLPNHVCSACLKDELEGVKAETRQLCSVCGQVSEILYLMHDSRPYEERLICPDCVKTQNP